MAATPALKDTFEAILSEIQGLRGDVQSLQGDIEITKQLVKYQVESTFGVNPEITDIVDGPPFPP